MIDKRFKYGDRVKHMNYGKGTIIEDVSNQFTEAYKVRYEKGVESISSAALLVFDKNDDESNKEPNMKKVIFPKEVAQAIETVVNHHHDDAFKHILLTNWGYLNKFFNQENTVLYNFAKEYMIDYVNGIINGYEVEQTPDDKVKAIYDEVLEIILKPLNYQPATVTFSQGVATGVLKTLAAYGIEIDGIINELEHFQIKL